MEIDRKINMAIDSKVVTLCWIRLDPGRSAAMSPLLNQSSEKKVNIRAGSKSQKRLDFVRWNAAKY